MEITVDASYVRGFVDRASQVDMERGCIVVTSKSPGNLEKIKEFLLRHGIKSTVTDYRNTNYRLRISGREAIERYCAVVGTNNADRYEKLKKLSEPATT